MESTRESTTRFDNPEGRRIPDLRIRTREDGEWSEVRTREIFDNRTVVVFALPGAFTPTCSATHLPRYEALADRLREAGVDEIVCVSVNDPFVMEAWARDQGVRKVRLLPDGNGEFTRAMGMLTDKSDLGFGERSWRYSMLVRDGLVEKAFVEPEVEGDPFTVSDADTMLASLDPEREAQPEVAIFTRNGCPHCARAKSALSDRGWDYREVSVDGSDGGQLLSAVSGATAVPQVFIDGELVGGADQLQARLANAE